MLFHTHLPHFLKVTIFSLALLVTQVGHADEGILQNLLGTYTGVAHYCFVVGAAPQPEDKKNDIGNLRVTITGREIVDDQAIRYQIELLQGKNIDQGWITVARNIEADSSSQSTYANFASQTQGRFIDWVIFTLNRNPSEFAIRQDVAINPGPFDSGPCDPGQTSILVLSRLNEEEGRR